LSESLNCHVAEKLAFIRHKAELLQALNCIRENIILTDVYTVPVPKLPAGIMGFKGGIN
jgi:hypothetical protein